MLLHTLGGLELAGSSFRRPKPLLLLCYLTLEGPQDRRHLAELFWPGASHALGSLSTALNHLRHGAPGAVEASETRVWSVIRADAQELVEALERADAQAALELYRGPFLEAFFLPQWSAELEEWVYLQRERLAEGVREALLGMAEEVAAKGDFRAAAALAEKAWSLPGASEPEPESLGRFHALLCAGDSVRGAEVRRAAEEYDIRFSLTSAEARARLRQVFVGRRHECERLDKVAPGEWAWVRGGAGIGKTSLLKQLKGTYLPARAGLPYITLEPLVGSAVEAGEPALLQRLATRPGRWLIDDWERMDEESRALLVRLRERGSAATVVIASAQPPPFAVGVFMELTPLPREVLEQHERLWEATGGVPALVGAQLRGEPLTPALDVTLGRLPAEARRVYLSLALLDDPDLAVVRRALGLDAASMAEALETLFTAGLADTSGRIWPRKVTRDYLEARPTLLGELATRLAQQLEGVRAFPLYKAAYFAWDDATLPAVREAYLAWADELLARGFPQRAAETLAEVTPDERVTLLRARALERAGLFRDAYQLLQALPSAPEKLALEAALHWRLGRPEEARRAAEAALEGDTTARAEAFNTLGHLARTQGDYAEAARSFRRAAALWRGLGERARWADALNNVAITWGEEGRPPDETEVVFREALEAAGDNLVLKARILLNLGIENERRGAPDEAQALYRQGIAVAREAGQILLESELWSNLGVCHARQGQGREAAGAYANALELIRKVGDQRALGFILANYAELTEDFEAWDEALTLLERSGNSAAVARYWQDLPDDHPFRSR